MSKYKTVFLPKVSLPAKNKFTLPTSVDGFQLAIDAQICIEEYEALGYELFSSESILASEPKSGSYWRTTIGMLMIFKKTNKPSS